MFCGRGRERENDRDRNRGNDEKNVSHLERFMTLLFVVRRPSVSKIALIYYDV